MDMYLGEGFAGALEWREFIKMAMKIGFSPPILVSSTLYNCSDDKLKDMLG